MLKATDRAKGTKSQIVGGSRGNAIITGSTKMEPPVNDAPTLSDLGINKKTSSLAQKLSDLPEVEVTAIKTSVRTGNSITKAAGIADKNPLFSTTTAYQSPVVIKASHAYQCF